MYTDAKRREEEKRKASFYFCFFETSSLEERSRLQNHLTIPLRFEIKTIETKIFQHRYDTK